MSVLLAMLDLENDMPLRVERDRVGKMEFKTVEVSTFVDHDEYHPLFLLTVAQCRLIVAE